MRLINADRLVSMTEMSKVFPDLTDECCRMLQLIDEQPTVYDTEYLITQLKKYVTTIHIDKKNGVSVDGVLLEDAISIVMGVMSSI